MKEVERQYVVQSHEEDVIMQDVDEEEEAEVQAELGEESESESDDEHVDQGHDSDEDKPPALPDGKNEMLTVGFNKNRSYVVRSGKIGVFKSNDQGKMEHHGTLSSVKDSKGKEFTPKKMMLHDQDNAMILMDPRQQNSLYKMDIERGKVVEEWKVDDNIPVLHMAPESKFAQTQPERTILGASGNALFRLDPRLAGSKLVNSEYKQYSTPNKFSGLTTTEAGQVAVASEKGDIRLFDKVGKNAKTALPAMGDPILGVDVTKDGRWVVATCRTYLLVIDTLIPEGRYTGQLGFDRSFPADAKPAPKRLRVQNAHLQYMGGNVNFTPARFDMGEGQEETSIVTSSGNYVIAWDFKAIKRGKYDKYEIRKYQDVVVQDQFKYGHKNDIVVALQNDVVMVNKKHLKDPAQSKSYGGAPRRSSSKIVKSPF